MIHTIFGTAELEVASSGSIASILPGPQHVSFPSDSARKVCTRYWRPRRLLARCEQTAVLLPSPSRGKADNRSGRCCLARSMWRVRYSCRKANWSRWHMSRVYYDRIAVDLAREEATAYGDVARLLADSISGASRGPSHDRNRQELGQSIKEDGNG